MYDARSRRAAALVSTTLLSLTTTLCMALSFTNSAHAQTGVSDERVSLPDGPGSIGGVGENAEVNPNMGAMSYSVKVDMPEGFPTSSPSLGFGYSSSAGNSLLGIGWGMGQPAIERMSLRGLPEYTTADEFSAGGELIYIGTTGGVRTYRTRFEDGFVRYKWYAAADGGEGYWTSEQGDGSIGYYGADAKGKLVSTARVSGDAGTFRYHLVTLVDPFGHHVDYTYRKSGETSLLDAISYAHGKDGKPRFSARFVWEDRPDVISTCIPGFDLRLEKRLAEVRVLSLTTIIKRYALTYEDAKLAGGFSRLADVEQLGVDDAKFPVHFKFQYSRTLGGTCTAANCEKPYLVNMGTLPGGVDLATGKATLIDINGDALPDMLSTTDTGVHTFYYAQLDAKGIPKFMAPKASAATKKGSSFVLGVPGVQVLDVNGDGRTDIISSKVGEVLCNDGSGDWNGNACLMNSTLPDMQDDDDIGDQNPLYTRFFDFDDDKRIDMIQTQDTGTFVYRNTGKAFVSQEVDKLDAQFDVDPTYQFADINGDGLQDPVQLPPGGQLSYRLNLGFGHWSDLVEVSLPGLTDALRPLASLEDLDGDGLADVVVVAGNEVRYARNRNGAQFDAFVKLTSDDIDGDMPERGANTVVLFADMNGNGSDDVVWVNGGKVQFLELFPVKPNLLTRIENGIGSVQELAYGSSVVEQARDAATDAWDYGLPMAMNVVVKADNWVTLTAGENGKGLHSEITYRYHDGFYDGEDKSFRGYSRVELERSGDAKLDSQDAGMQLLEYDNGVTDAYHNGLLVKRSSFSGSGKNLIPLLEERFEFGDCKVDGIPKGASLAFPVRHVCQLAELKIVQEGAPKAEWITTREEKKYDGYGEVVANSDLGVIHQGPPESAKPCGECSGPSGAFGAACGPKCLGDEKFEETTYIEPGTGTGNAWFIGKPISTKEFGVAGGITSISNTYYDGDAFKGLAAGKLTKGLATRVEDRENDSGKMIDSSRIAYNDDGLVVTTLDPLGTPGDDSGHLRNYTYDASGMHVAKTEIPLTDKDGSAYSLVREVLYEQTFMQPSEATMWMVVRGGDELTSRNSARYRYDKLGRIERIIKTGDSDDAPTERYTYDLADPVSTISVHRRTKIGGDEDLLQVRCIDGRGREVQRRIELGEGRWYVNGFRTFNRNGEVVREYQPFESKSAKCDMALPDGVKFTAMRYDALGRHIESTQPDEDLFDTASVARIVYSPLTITNFDVAANDEKSPSFGVPKVERYNGLDMLVAMDRQKSDTEGGGMATTRMYYDGLGRLSNVIDPKGNEHVQTYDLLDRMVEVNDPNAGTISYVYDAVGNLLEQENALGERTVNTFDGMNRLVSRYDSANKDASLITQEFDYAEDCDSCTNSGGRLVRSHYDLGPLGEGVDSFGYDARGNDASQTKLVDGVELVTEMTYDDAERLLETVMPDGTSFSRSWDAGDRLAGIDGVIDSVDYDARGQLGGFAFANGVKSKMSYDARTRLSELQVLGKSGDVLQGVSFERDRLGMVLAMKDTSSDRKLRPDWTSTFEYDSWHRVTKASFGAAKNAPEALSYAYDDIDNIVSMTSTLKTSLANQGDYTYDGAAPNAATKVGKTEYDYDDAGRMSTRADRAYTWDYRGKLVKTTQDEATLGESFYDAEGARVAKIEGGSVTIYDGAGFEVRDGVSSAFVTFDTKHLAMKRSAKLMTKFLKDQAPLGKPDGKITAADAWLAIARVADDMKVSAKVSDPDRLLAASARRTLLEASDDTLYFNHDGAGSVTLATNADGDIIGERAYYPNGETRFEEGYVGEYGFANRERDASTGLTHFRERELDTSAGRWTQPDPAFMALTSTNARDVGEAMVGYAYVGNDPVNWDDPTGLARGGYKNAALKSIGKGAVGGAKWLGRGAKSLAGKAAGKIKGKYDAKYNGKAWKAFSMRTGALVSITGSLTRLVGAIVLATADENDTSQIEAARALQIAGAATSLAGDTVKLAKSFKTQTKKTGYEKAQYGLAMTSDVISLTSAIMDSVDGTKNGSQESRILNLAGTGIGALSFGMGLKNAPNKGTPDAQMKAKVVGGVGVTAMLLLAAKGAYDVAFEDDD